MRILLLLLAVFPASVSAQEALVVDLECPGSGIGTVSDGTTSTVVSDNYGNSAHGVATTRRAMHIEDTVLIRIRGGEGEIKPPSAALPPVNSGKGGWFKIKDLKVSEYEISGKVSYNFIASSKFKIDRSTGLLTSTGTFRATCHAIERTPESRKF